eukprot:TRINITY_DN9474_c0_g3_i2.p1 TRINITY_DN9474_c0_g3~~TRINITY_DN9474_c0_g3_i2.p1  ORF type:complete len:247 (+),score=76.55 TRINITY_DN9474_c0_g3_i2:394-1134(+)
MQCKARGKAARAGGNVCASHSAPAGGGARGGPRRRPAAATRAAPAAAAPGAMTLFDHSAPSTGNRQLTASEMAQRYITLSVGLALIAAYGAHVLLGYIAHWITLLIDSTALTAMGAYTLWVFHKYEKDMNCKAVQVTSQVNPLLFAELGVLAVQTGVAFAAGGVIVGSLNGALAAHLMYKLAVARDFLIDPSNLWRDAIVLKWDTIRKLLFHVFCTGFYLVLTVELTSTDKYGLQLWSQQDVQEEA